MKEPSRDERRLTAFETHVQELVMALGGQPLTEEELSWLRQDEGE